MNKDESIGARIVRARASLDWSQAELASRAAIAPTQLARYENGKTKPRPEMVHRLATLLDVSPDWLMSGSGAINDHEFGGQPARGGKEVTMDLSSAVWRALREQAGLSGRSMADELEQVISAGTKVGLVELHPNLLVLRVPDTLKARLSRAASVAKTDIRTEILGRLTASLDADDVAHETAMRETPLPAGAVVDEDTKVLAKRLSDPKNRAELETLLATIRTILSTTESGV